MSGAAQRKSSLVDYSKVSDRPVQDARFAKKHQPAAASAPAAAPSAQMDAVMRLMTGREERTIAEKLADSNRPTWEQYKKDNQDKLNLDGLDQKQMEEYRQQLDAERDRRMAGGGAADRKKKSKKKKKRKKRRRDDESSDNGNSDSEASSSGLESSDERRRRRKHKKRHKHKKKRHHSDTDEDDEADRKKKTRHAKMKDKEGGDDESDGDHYRLSNFFAEGADE
jgi:hypothetical protein